MNTNLENNVLNSKIEKFTISLIAGGEINNICLNDFKKNIITFGRAENNDIIIPSLFVSSNHGYFELTNSSVRIVDNKSKNGIYVNNNKTNNIFLKDGDSIKIDNPEEPLKNGIIMILSCGNNTNIWQQYNINKEITFIGRSNDCDITLDHISISLKHARIIKKRDIYTISNCDNNCMILVNGNLLNGTITLKDRDAILIANVKLIYIDGQIFYQVYSRGVNLDAVDIVKTVRIKGKKKDISQHVNLSIKEGQFVAFVGGSGTGKSTFMNCISGFSKPTSGKVFINGTDLFENYSVLKNIIGYVPQDDIVFKNLTLITMLNYAANLRMPDDTTYQEKNKRIDEVLKIVELSDKKNVMIKNLSGGQRKRASIAIELIADPKLFFLDEPTSGLDPGTERSLMQTLRKMTNSGKTIVLVTHNTLNLHLCDKVVFFGLNGRLCYQGTPKDALNFFQVNDLVDVYTLLNNDTKTWHEKFLNSQYNEKIYVNKKNETDDNNKKRSKKNNKNNKSFFKQFATLSKRYIKTILNNKQQLMLLILQSPLIAFLMSLIVTSDLFEYYDETKSILFAIANSAIWLGLLNSIQEICKERTILKKEYMANLKISSYLCSKIFVMLLLATIQALLFLSTFSLLLEVPIGGVIFGWYPEMLITLISTIFSASTLGLCVSTLSKDASVAMTYAPLFIIPQLLFSGMFFKLEGIVEFISNFVLCRWSVEAMGTTNDLNSLITSIQDYIPGFVREIEKYFEFTTNHFFNNIGIIWLMSLILFVISHIILKRQLESGK